MASSSRGCVVLSPVPIGKFIAALELVFGLVALLLLTASVLVGALGLAGVTGKGRSRGSGTLWSGSDVAGRIRGGLGAL